MTEMLLSDSSMRIMIATLEREGIDPGPAVRAAGMDPEFYSLRRYVTREQERAFQHGFVSLTGRRPDLWFRMGKDYSLATFGSFAPAMMTAPNLRVMLSNPNLPAVGFHDIELRPIMADEALIGVEFDASGVPAALRELAILVSLGCVVRLYPELLGEEIAFSLLCVPMDDPDGSLQAQTDIPMSFNAERPLVLWPAGYSERPLLNSNPVLYAGVVAAMERLVEGREPARLLKEAVSASIAGHLDKQSVLESVARDLGFAARTLQRRLKESGLEFRTMLDEARNEAAIRMLMAEDTPLIEIAWSLGYSDISSFTHAFRRWSGSTPGKFRHQIRGGSA